MQEVAILEDYHATRFYPAGVVVLKDVPLDLYISRLHREHINKFTIEPFLSSTNFFPPGTLGIEQFTPNQTGEFKMHNVGHGYEGDFVVVDTVAEARRRIADKGIQEFSLIHDLEGGRIAPSRLIVQKDVPVRFYNTSLKGQERVSIELFVMPVAPNIRDGVITTIDFTPDVAGEFTIRYDNHAATGTLVVESGAVESSPGDANGDGVVNVADLRTVAAALGTSDSTADLNGDGLVDIRDLVLVGMNFGLGGQP